MPTCVQKRFDALPDATYGHTSAKVMLTFPLLLVLCVLSFQSS